MPVALGALAGIALASVSAPANAANWDFKSTYWNPGYGNCGTDYTRAGYLNFVSQNAMPGACLVNSTVDGDDPNLQNDEYTSSLSVSSGSYYNEHTQLYTQQVSSDTRLYIFRGTNCTGTYRTISSYWETESDYQSYRKGGQPC